MPRNRDQEADEQQPRHPEQPRPSTDADGDHGGSLGCGLIVDEALACGNCNAVLFGPDDFVTARAEGLKPDAVYAYELDDVCGHDKLWVYSATNPHERRFDVARVKARVVERESVCLGGVAPTPDHTWFPPFAWNMASCASCGHHLGWGFYDTSKLPSPAAAAAPSSPAAASCGGDSNEAEENDSEDQEEEEEEEVAAPDSVLPEFAGIILTSCVAVSAAASAENGHPLRIPTRADFRSTAEAQREYAVQRRAVIAALQAAPNQVVASQLAMLLMHLDKTPSARAQLLPQLVDAARRLTAAGTGGAHDEDADDQSGASDAE